MNYTIKPEGEIEFEGKSLYAAFQKLSDGRKRRSRRYELALILTLSVLAKLAGEDEPEGMVEWVKLRGDKLRKDLGIGPTRRDLSTAVKVCTKPLSAETDRFEEQLKVAGSG